MSEEAEVPGSTLLFLNASVSRLSDLLTPETPERAITGRVKYKPEGGKWRMGEREEQSTHSRRRHAPKRNI